MVLAESRQPTSVFGGSVAIAGNLVVVGQLLGSTSGVGTGRACVYTLDLVQGTAALLADLGSPQVVANVQFGTICASPILFCAPRRSHQLRKQDGIPPPLFYPRSF